MTQDATRVTPFTIPSETTTHSRSRPRAFSVEALRARFYADPLARDPVAAFCERISRRVAPGDVVLDLGAGAGRSSLEPLRRRVRRIVGVDRDPRIGTNAQLDASVLGDAYGLPLHGGSFDAVFSVYVLEHVEHPGELAREIFRVLRPGGFCMVITPNVFHYVTLLSRVTPTSVHQWVNERRGRPADDTFPTWYRLNSRRALARCFGRAGFLIERIETIEVQPNYLTCCAGAYLAGVAFERLVNAWEGLAGLRVNLIGTFRKPDWH